jgi:DNA-binding SARP family transcriptional activator
MRYQILGPVELLGGDGDRPPTRLGGPKQRAVLALLLLNANQVVSEQRFLTLVWGDDPPVSVRGQLQMYVSQLRKLIGEPVIIRRPPGYLIQVRPGELDLDVFDDLAQRARTDLAAGRAEDAVEGFRAALDLWHGPALDGVSEPMRDREVPALGERRLAMLEEYLEALLVAGRHDQVVREARAAAEENPLRERLWAQLMVALDRAGRTAEALEVYTVTRDRLVAERGVEPGVLLRDTHRRLQRDETAPAPADATIPRQLPGDVLAFAGRAAELARLDAVLPAGSLAVITGGAGVGKTTLAVRWAHRASNRFPDGQLYANLRGFDPNGHAVTPDDVARSFLSALNIPTPAIPAAAEARFSLFRSLLADKRMLVVLDNARDAAQVRPLLPGAPGCLTVVTSRDQLGSLITAEGAAPVVLGLLSPAEARDLFTRRVGAARVEAEPEAVAEIAELCARLPLALAIVAARAATHPSFSLAGLAEELRVARGDLDVFDLGDPVANVRAVFSWSYRTLGGPAARLFRLLGLTPGPHVTVAAAASLLGEPVSGVRPLLAELTRAHLVTEQQPGRYGRHDLLRAYAAELADGEDMAADRHAATWRMLDHYLHTAERAARIMRPQRVTPTALAPAQEGVTVAEIRTEQRAVDWFGAEYAVVHAAVAQAAETGFDAHAWQLADTLTATHSSGGARWLGDRAVYETALAAATRLGDRDGQALSHRGLAIFSLAHHRIDDTETELLAALELAEEIGDVGLQADMHVGLGGVCGAMGRGAEQLRHVETGLDLFRAAGNRLGVANSYNNLAWCLVTLGEAERAVTLCKQAIEMLTDMPDRKNEAAAWDTLGYANARLGHHDEAITCYQRAIELSRQVNSRLYESGLRRQIGDLHAERGATSQARASWREAARILEDLRLPTDELDARING